jgi:hypothetical protein
MLTQLHRVSLSNLYVNRWRSVPQKPGSHAPPAAAEGTSFRGDRIILLYHEDRPSQ